jgi:hypothetical protein
VEVLRLPSCVNLVARLEYLYDDFGSKDYIGVTGDPYRIHFTGQTVRGVLAWKFDPFGNQLCPDWLPNKPGPSLRAFVVVPEIAYISVLTEI